MLQGAYRAGCLVLPELRGDVIHEEWAGSPAATWDRAQDLARNLLQGALVRITDQRGWDSAQRQGEYGMS